MKPLWWNTLAWIAAVLAAVLLAMAYSDGSSVLFGDDPFSHGANVPR